MKLVPNIKLEATNITRGGPPASAGLPLSKLSCIGIQGRDVGSVCAYVARTQLTAHPSSVCTCESACPARKYQLLSAKPRKNFASLLGQGSAVRTGGGGEGVCVSGGVCGQRDSDRVHVRMHQPTPARSP